LPTIQPALIAVRIWLPPSVAALEVGANRRRRANGAARKPMNGINAPQRPDSVAGHVGLELRNVGANYSFERSRKFRESSGIPAMETVRVLSCGCDSGLNIREDTRTIAFDISMAAVAP